MGMLSGLTGLAGRLAGRNGKTQKANRAARVIVDKFELDGVGEDWARTSHATLMTTSASVHAAMRVRSEAVARPRLEVLRRGRPGGALERVDETDPLQSLLDRPNPHWSRGDLWRATEISLLAWGSAYWGIERAQEGGAPAELWPLRADRMRVLPDSRRYVRGFVYDSGWEQVAYLQDEVAHFRHINPLDEFSGLSSVQPARASLEMAQSALRFNRDFFTNSAIPADLAFTQAQGIFEEDMEAFLKEWEEHHSGPGRWHLPTVLPPGVDLKRISGSHRDMEFMGTLDWSVAEVSRSFGVPKVFLAEFEDATRANVDAMERFLWRNTVVPELKMLEDTVTRTVVPLFESFPGEYAVRFDLSEVEALREDANLRVQREVALIDAGVLTAEEVRQGYGLGAE